MRPAGRLVLSNMTKGERRRHRVWDWLYAHGINLTANCRGVLAALVLAELGFSEIRREYMTQMLFPPRSSPLASRPAETTHRLLDRQLARPRTPSLSRSSTLLAWSRG